MINNPPSPKYLAALDIINRLKHAGYEALFTGGAVRDMLMGGGNDGDIDIATNARPESVSRLFSHTIPVGVQFGVMIVVIRGIPFEVATFRSDTGTNDGRHPADVVFTDARTDALRRDFTINGLFYDPLTSEVHDYVGGRADITGCIVRAIGEPSLRFKEDYLRLLRAVRFAARFDFLFDAATWNAVAEQAGNIVHISVERIFAELDKMFRGPHADRALELLDESGLLKMVLPEVAALKGVEQPPEFHPEGDVFEHTKKALSLLPPQPSSTLVWSLLLHDIGKPDTMVKADRLRFNNHDQVGMHMARQVLKKFHTSNLLIDDTADCIANHMNFMNVKRMRLGTLKRLLSRPTIETEMELHRLDCMSSHGNCENYEFVKEQLAVFKAESLKPQPLLGGKDLIVFGFKPGPLFGEILDRLYDLQLEEAIVTRDDAVAFLREHYRPT